VDDDPAMCALLRDGLSRRGFDPASTPSPPEALARVAAEDFDALVTDLNMRGMNGVELCERVAGVRPDLPVLLITAFGSLDSAVAAIRAGAYDFVTKPFELDQIVLALERAVRFRRLNQELTRLRSAVAATPDHAPLFGESPAMAALRDLLRRAAASDATILLVGETGTGKELAARQIHALSSRRAGPLVSINCAAVPEQLLESELFGHVRGAFTDARADRRGLLAQAAGGTILLDEVGDMPMSLQPKLLRALQDRRARPVGSDTESEFDVRVIAATNRDLEQHVAEGRFRQDLFFRLNVIQVELPPLRTRGNDVLLLGQRFLEAAAARSGKPVTGLTPPAAAKLLAYSWPGNVRELQNCMERAVAVAAFDRLTVEDLPERIRNYTRTQLPLIGDAPGDLPPLEEVERRYIDKVLEAVGGNRTEASRILGVDRKTLYRKLKAESGNA
jgi:two-component system, NtrC family, response regulator AtoC